LCPALPAPAILVLAELAAEHDAEEAEQDGELDAER